MKLRLWPVAITVLLSSSLLFGGWFVYRSVAIENPLNHTIDHITGVKSENVQIDNRSVRLSLTLEPGADLRQIYQEIEKKGASFIGKRTLTIQVDNPSSPELDDIWSTALFDVAQAMETHAYSGIPTALKQLEGDHKGLVATSAMDDANVYIHLALKGKDKYVILPRVAPMGVWPGE